jgi:ATP-dependent DNA helicase RecQ
VRAAHHDALPTFGVGRATSRHDWQAIFRQMMGRDLLRPDPERHGALRMTDAARPILRGEARITLRRDTMRPAAAPARRSCPRMTRRSFRAQGPRRAFAEARACPPMSSSPTAR